MFRVGASVVVVGAIAAALVPTRATAKSAAPQLVVRLYDAFGVAPEQMATARTTADGVFKRAGIDVIWRNCRLIAMADPSSTLCDHAVEPQEVLLRIIAAGSHGTAGSLGYSSVDALQKSYCLATVLADRIGALATRTHVDGGKLLGRVMVHEIAHLLLGTPDHSPVGLMRARWSDDQVQRERPVDWMLSPDDVKRVRLGFLARVRVLTAAARHAVVPPA